MARRGRISARPTNRIRAVDEQHHLSRQVGVFHARLGEESGHQPFPSAQVRQGGLTNGVAGEADLERGVDERASSLRSGAQGVLDHIEERQDHRLTGLR